MTKLYDLRLLRLIHKANIYSRDHFILFSSCGETTVGCYIHYVTHSTSDVWEQISQNCDYYKESMEAK